MISVICNANRTEWSPIRSVIIRVINIIENRTTAYRESDLFNHEYDYRPNWTSRSSVTNKLITTLTKFVIHRTLF